MSKSNPWLEVSAEDYEGHMGHPHVAQLDFLASVLRELLEDLRPESLAVPGSAMGTGFEHIDPGVTLRVLALDIQGEYLRILRKRHGERLPGLHALETDLSDFEYDGESFDLVYAALIFEYLDPAMLVRRLSGWLRQGGTLATVLQLPVEEQVNVSDTPFEGVRILEPMIQLVDPEALKGAAASAGLHLRGETVRRLDSGKEFHVARFIRMT